MHSFTVPGGRVLLRTAAVGLVAILLFGLGAELLGSQARGEEELLERFRLRAEIGSKFLAGYVDDLLARERVEATVELRAADVTERRFTRLARAYGFPAAVLLDAQGRLLAVEPPAPDRLGSEIAGRYPHLTAALEGRAAVSNVVSSSVGSMPVVEFAVPFSTPDGRRVFSGALAIGDTTLGSSYLKHLVPLSGSRVYLVDATAATIASSLDAEQVADLMQQRDRSLWEAIASGDEGSYEGSGGEERFALSPVEGTPWRLVISAPEAVLLAPVGGAGRWLSRLIFAALCLALALVIVLFRQLAKARARRLAEVERLSVTDSLTGLYNRRGHELLASQVLRSGVREGTMVAILLLDLDGLKQVNDELGHDVGDRMLVSAADVLRQTFRDSDVIARLGGDEFCVVGAVPGPTFERVSPVSRLEENLARHNATSNRGAQVSLSVGVSWFDPRDPRSLDELVREADQRMYEDKRGRRLAGRSPASTTHQPPGD